jgi:2-succinyl-6-hydroxy-2,4-cyclohexadiene-1-carboxylate synthase
MLGLIGFLRKEEMMKINANGINMNYELTGEGRCLVLIHGFSDNLTMWYNQVPEFSKQYQVLIYDVRGHGQTETPEGQFSMDLFADDLQALLEVLNIEKACVLGYSMGGRIGLEFAFKYPDRITGLVFANSGIMGPDLQITEEQMKEMMERREEMMELFKTGDIETIADAMAERSLSPGLKDKKPGVFQKYKEVKLANDPKHYLSIMEGMMAAMATPPDLSQLKCPALIIAGEHDGFMSLDVVKSMEKAIKDATSTIFPTGHASAVEDPEGFNRAVFDFMKRL